MHIYVHSIVAFSILGHQICILVVVVVEVASIFAVIIFMRRSAFRIKFVSPIRSRTKARTHAHAHTCISWSLTWCDDVMWLDMIQRTSQMVGCCRKVQFRHQIEKKCGNDSRGIQHAAYSIQHTELSMPRSTILFLQCIGAPQFLMDCCKKSNCCVDEDWWHYRWGIWESRKLFQLGNAIRSLLQERLY